MVSRIFLHHPYFPPRRSLSQISFDQIQDSCNKSTAIYWTVSTSYSAKKNLDHVHDGGDRVAMINSIYPQWFRGHHMDIEFGNFVAKLVCIETTKKKQEAMIQDIIAIHLAWCDHVIATLPRFAVEKIGIEGHGPLGINQVNQEQNKYYKLRPLFRALIIIVDRNVSEGAEPVVYLICTGITSGLSAPITFENIKAKIVRTPDLDNENTITVTLSTAVDFIMTLESREKSAAGPQNPEDQDVSDGRMGNLCSPTEWARHLGYTGPEIRGPSANWAKLAEFDDASPPVTRNAQMGRLNAGLPLLKVSGLRLR